MCAQGAGRGLASEGQALGPSEHDNPVPSSAQLCAQTDGSHDESGKHDRESGNHDHAQSCAPPGGAAHSSAGSASVASGPAADAKTKASVERPRLPFPVDDVRWTVRFHLPPDLVDVWRDVHDVVERLQKRPASSADCLEAIADAVILEYADVARECAKAHPVLERDSWRCSIPTCSNRALLHDHHIRFRSNGGSDEMKNRVGLCLGHHLQGIHARRIHMVGSAPEALLVLQGLRPDGRPHMAFLGGQRLAVA